MMIQIVLNQRRALAQSIVRLASSLSQQKQPVTPGVQQGKEQSSSTGRRLVDFLKTDQESSNSLKYYDPPYLSREAPFPNYDLLTINFKGYDYVVLEQYYKYVDRLCNSLNVDVVQSYAVPSRNYKVKTLKPYSTTVDKEFDLNLYHRVVRIQNLKSTLAPLLFESIQLNLPEGVQMVVSRPTPEEDEYRFVPDIELTDLKSQLEELSKKPKDAAAAAAAVATPTPAAAKPAAAPAAGKAPAAGSKAPATPAAGAKPAAPAKK